jgi:hypothetical protein
MPIEFRFPTIARKAFASISLDATRLFKPFFRDAAQRPRFDMDAPRKY